MAEMRVLRLGDENPSVWVLETKLKMLGFFKGFSNETFDKETEIAVRDFQRFAAITVDGIVGPKTWATLFGRPVAITTITSAAKRGGYWIAVLLGGVGLIWLTQRFLLWGPKSGIGVMKSRKG